MQISRNNICLTSFQAKVPKEIKTKILAEAVEYGTRGLDEAKNQLLNVEKWGNPSTYIDLAVDLKEGKEYLGITNMALSKLYGATFKQKTSMFDTFMSLREKDIIKAENQIKNEVAHSKMDLMSKALIDNKLMKKITGESNPSNEKLTTAIDKLTEEEIVNLRFGLDKPSKFESDEPLGFDF